MQDVCSISLPPLVYNFYAGNTQQTLNIMSYHHVKVAKNILLMLNIDDSPTCLALETESIKMMEGCVWIQRE